MNKTDIVILKNNKKIFVKSVNAKDKINYWCNITFCKCYKQFGPSDLCISEETFKKLIYEIIFNSDLIVKINSND